MTSSSTPELDDLTDDEWRRLLSYEMRLCREPGALDAGTHLIVLLQTPYASAGPG